jgi:hypothetical protein
VSARAGWSVAASVTAQRQPNVDPRPVAELVRRDPSLPLKAKINQERLRRSALRHLGLDGGAR